MLSDASAVTDPAAPAPDGTPVSPLPLLKLLGGVHGSAALRAAIELRVFDALADRPLDAPAVAGAVGGHPRATRVLLDLLASLGVVERSGDRYALTSFCRHYLVSGSPDYIGAASGIHLHDFVWEAERRLAESVRAGGSVVSGVGNPYEHPFWRDFAEASGWIAEGGARRTAELLAPWAKDRAGTRILDLCAGSGRYGCHLAAVLPGADVTLLDWPGVLDVRRDTAERAAVADRVSEIAGDLFTVDYRGPYDLILLNNVLHNFGPDDCARLLERVTGALAPGGRVVVQELTPTGEEDERDHVAHVFGVLMLAISTQGQVYPLDELNAMLTKAGLDPVALHHAPPHLFSVFLMADKAA